MYKKKGDANVLRKIVMSVVFGLCLLVSGTALANGNMPKEKCNGNRDCYEKGTNLDKNWQEKMKQKQQILLSLVNKYTPEKKKEWEAVIKERNLLMQKWLSPQFAEKREQWKKENMGNVEDLHKQYEEGKITKEEFLKQIHKGKELGHWKIYQELKESLKNHDDQKTAQLLNRLLVHYKQKNEKLKAVMKS